MTIENQIQGLVKPDSSSRITEARNNQSLLRKRTRVVTLKPPQKEDNPIIRKPPKKRPKPKMDNPRNDKSNIIKYLQKKARTQVL